MLEQTEWDELLRYLLERLIEADAADAAARVRTAAATRIIEEPTGTLARVTKVQMESVGKTLVRPPTPRESFVAAFDVLHIRLTQIPAITDRLVHLLGRSANEISWKAETEVERSGAAEFSADVLLVDAPTRERIDAALSRLNAMIEES